MLLYLLKQTRPLARNVAISLAYSYESQSPKKESCSVVRWYGEVHFFIAEEE